MQDRELEFVDSLIKESRRADALFLVFGFTLILSGLSSFFLLLTHSGIDKIFFGATGGIASLFSGIPACFFFAARGNAIYLGFLKASWQDAIAENNVSMLEKLSDELTDFSKGTLSKPYWSIR